MKPPNFWILGVRQDLLLFVATPLLLLPLLFLIDTPGSIETFGVYVAAFGALGHHFPGMLRAYGDRALFQRFKVRFVVAPVFLLALCVGCAVAGINAPLAVFLLWGIWHTLAQVYGFARIYDGKVRSIRMRTARFDLLLLVFWWVTVVLSSDQTCAVYAGRLYEAGAPLVSPETLAWFKAGWLAATGLFTVAYVVNAVLCWRQGSPPSFVKLLALAVSMSFFWFTYGNLHSLILGNALFEIFHDIQYLSIVWIYNRKRVDSSTSAGSFTRFLFRNSWALMGAYVGMVFAYGAISLLSSREQTDLFSKVLVGVITASTLLHFYYDGFIWKVREQETGANLGIASAGTGASGLADAPTPFLPGWARHGLKWGVLVALIAWAAHLQLTAPTTMLERYQNLGAIAPASWRVQNELGRQFVASGDQLAGLAAYERAAALAPEEASVFYNRGVALQEMGNLEQAAAEYQHALELRPGYDAVLFRLGTLRARQRRGDEAMAYFAQVEPLIRSVAQAASGYCVSLILLGRDDEALARLRESITTWPDDLDLNFNRMLQERRTGNDGAARAALQKLRLLAPDSADINIYQAWLLGAQPVTPEDPAVAVVHAERARDLRGGVPDALLADTLGIAYAAAGRFPEAIASVEAALAISERGFNLPRGANLQRVREAMQARLELYRAGVPYRAPADSRDFGLLPMAFR